MPNLLGIDRLKSLKNNSSPCMPPHSTQPHIKMFMLSKEKERLEGEGARMDTRREFIAGRLKEIEKGMERLRVLDKRMQKKRKFNWDATGVKTEEVDPFQPDNPKIGSGWEISSLKRIKSLKRKR